MEKLTPAWWLSQQLLTKSVELAFEDPPLAMRLANLAVEASLRFGGSYDPYAAAEAVRKSRKRERRERLPPRAEPPPMDEPHEDEAPARAS